MKILQLTCHYLPNTGGVETHLSDLVTSLVDNKNQVFVLTYHPLTSAVSAPVLEKKNNLTIFRTPWFKGHFYQLVNKPLLEFFYLIPGIFIITPIILLAFRPKVIHAHGLAAGFVGVFWGKLFRRKVIISLHSIYQFPKKGLYTTFVRFVLGSADKTLVLSRQSAAEVVNIGVNSKKVSVFTYWIDLDHFKFVPKAKEKLHLNKKFVVLYVGRLVAEKGINELLSAAGKIRINVTFLIVGNGPLEEIVKHTKNKRVVYAGRIDQKDLPLYYSAADIVIVPSVHDEGFGRVILESIACGTPVIAADRPGIREALPPQAGMFIKVTPEIIIKSISALYNDRAKLNSLANKTRKLAEEKYSNRNADVIINAYG